MNSNARDQAMQNIPREEPDGELGIDISKLAAGTTILVETEDDRIFELKMADPGKGVAEISGTEPRMRRQPTLGMLTHSFSETIRIDKWIGFGLRMSLTFRNGRYESAAVMHATVRGAGWSYDVF
jgi:hypothetical protein